MADSSWVDQQAQVSLARLLPRLGERFATQSAEPDWSAFTRRLEANFPRMFGLFYQLYGRQYDFFYHLEQTLDMAAKSWLARPAELKALDNAREANPVWFQSNQMVGGVCYVDLFAGDLSGLRARLPYFKELGLTYLHLMPLFQAPEGNNDGGYAVSDYRQINPALGSLAELSALASELRQAGISLV